MTDIRNDYHGLVRADIVGLVPRAGGALLDVGGGIGATAALLKREGAVDRAGVVDLVAADPAQLGLDFHYSLNLEDDATVERIVAEQGQMQVILCLDVLEHVVDPWSLVTQLTKILAPGGHVVASIPNVRYYKLSFPLFFLGKWELADKGILDRTHLRWFTRKTATELMRSSGLVVEVVQGKLGGGRKVRLLNLLTLGLLSDFFTVQFLIRVRKDL